MSLFVGKSDSPKSRLGGELSCSTFILCKWKSPVLLRSLRVPTAAIHLLVIPPPHIPQSRQCLKLFYGAKRLKSYLRRWRYVHRSSGTAMQQITAGRCASRIPSQKAITISSTQQYSLTSATDYTRMLHRTGKRRNCLREQGTGIIRRLLLAMHIRKFFIGG